MKSFGNVLLIIGLILAVWQIVVGALGGLFWLGVVLVVLGIVFRVAGGKKPAGV